MSSASAAEPAVTPKPLPRLSVVVPTRDRPDRLNRCLDALRGCGDTVAEIVVVDSASRRRDEVAAVAADHGARLVRLDRPGASLARNAGWRATQGDLIAFVDDDCRAEPGWADAMVQALQHPGVGFVTGRVDVPPEHAGAERAVVFASVEARVIDRDAGGSLGGSGNLGVHRHVLEAIGGFDERLGPATWFGAAEDVDLFDRMLAAGHRGRFDPAATVLHEQWRVRSQLLELDWRYGKGMGGRIAKLVRTDRRRARAVAAETIWHGGIRVIVGDLRRRYEFGALLMSLRVAGILTGLAVGLVRLGGRHEGGTS